MATNIDLIKKYLPQEVRSKAKNFTIPEEFLQKMSELITLVLNSKSMDNDDEKQSWFNLMPLMTQEQIDKLNDILSREKIKLQEIEKKYEEKKRSIKEKYIKRRQAMWYTKKMNNIKEKENAFEQQDDKEADALLDNL